MLTIILGAFVGSMLFNLVVILFGTKDIEALKAKMSIGKYVRMLDEMIVDGLGDGYSTLLKVVAALIGLFFLLTHLVLALLVMVTIAAGVWAAKTIYRISSVANFLNKITTYINRLRN